MILNVDNVSKRYPVGQRRLLRRRDTIEVLRNIDLSVAKGESFGLIGESGSGKSTLARTILGLERVDKGTIRFEGTDLASLSPAALRALRARIQIVFQDPYASLNPRMSVQEIVAEPMLVHEKSLGLSRRQRHDRVAELMSLVGLRVQHLYRFPHEFSGGQRQRICIARTLSVNPTFLILDEPTSALDVQVQAQILNLLNDLRQRLGLTYLFISHDLGVVRYLCTSVAVIQKGEIVETGRAREVFAHPQHPYTRMLIDAMPDPDPRRSRFHSIAAAA